MDSKSLRHTLRIVCLLSAIACAAQASYITLDPIMVGTGADRLANDILYTDAIYAQMALDVLFEPEQLVTSYTGTALTRGTDMTITDTSDNLMTFLNDASWQEDPAITIWYVDHIYVSGQEARGITFVGTDGVDYRFGIGVSLNPVQYAHDTLAHEVAHVLTWYEPAENFICADPNVTAGPGGCVSGDPAHDATNTNLLAPGSIRLVPGSISQIEGQGSGNRDTITASQRAFMLTHTDFITTPEPAGVVLFGSGTFFVWLLRRRAA